MKNDVIQLDLPETDPNRPFIVYGPVRGLVSSHLTEAGAEASIVRDRKAARRTRSPYDAAIYERVIGGWKPKSRSKKPFAGSTFGRTRERGMDADCSCTSGLRLACSPSR